MLFGTDGIRGTYGELITEDLAYRVGAAYGSYLKKHEGMGTVFLGRDTRSSGDSLASAVALGLLVHGFTVEYLGILPSPAIAYLTRKHSGVGGVVISASHNPKEDNGIKLYTASGQKYTAKNEAEIEKEIQRISAPKESGFRYGVCERAEKYREEYVRWLTSLPFHDKERPLLGYRIFLDLANGSAGACAPTVFERLGASVLACNCEADGGHINEGCGAVSTDFLLEGTRRFGCDIGFAFDGDGDRVVGATSTGELLSGDRILYTIALAMRLDGTLQKNTIVGTVMSGLGFLEASEEAQISFIGVRVGDRNITEALLENGFSLGGEPSGHIIAPDYLPTGDGILSALLFLYALKRTALRPIDVVKRVKEYPSHTATVPFDIQRIQIFYEDEEIKGAILAAQKRIAPTGRIVVRPSGTEPVIRIFAEAKSKEAAFESVQIVSKAVMGARERSKAFSCVES